MASVILKNITKKFDGKVTAVDDFSLEIEDREFVIFVGPSGCGKTTTLRMVAGLEEITEGKIEIDGKLVNNIQSKDRDIAMVFQNYALYPHMSVFANMAFSLKLKKTPKKEITERVREVARILDIETLLERKPKALSGGQRQRVALGRAIIRNPKVFLMDEPLSNLDAKLRGQMRAEISKLHRNLQTTFIYVTHDQTEAMTMGSRIVVMKDGRIQQVDAPQTLYDRPQNMFVAGFIGNPQMNFIEAGIKSVGDETMVTFGNIDMTLPGEKAATLKKYLNGRREVVLGIRPESIIEERACREPEHYGVLDGEVELVEKLGAETLLHALADGTSLTAKVSNTTPAGAGDVVKLAVDTRAIHIFDKDTQQVIVN